MITASKQRAMMKNANDLMKLREPNEIIQYRGTTYRYWNDSRHYGDGYYEITEDCGCVCLWSITGDGGWHSDTKYRISSDYCSECKLMWLKYNEYQSIKRAWDGRLGTITELGEYAKSLYEGRDNIVTEETDSRFDRPRYLKKETQIKEEIRLRDEHEKIGSKKDSERRTIIENLKLRLTEKEKEALGLH